MSILAFNFFCKEPLSLVYSFRGLEAQRGTGIGCLTQTDTAKDQGRESDGNSRAEAEQRTSINLKAARLLKPFILASLTYLSEECLSTHLKELFVFPEEYHQHPQQP